MNGELTEEFNNIILVIAHKFKVGTMNNLIFFTCLNLTTFVTLG